MTSQLFVEEAGKVFGQRGANQRYHMPLLPGETPPKAKGADWVPWGVQSVTNLVGAFEDTRALSTWEQALALVGLALAPELHGEMVLIVHEAISRGVPYDDKTLRAMLAGYPGRAGESIIGRAKDIAKANAAAQRGTNAHRAWEHRGKTGELIGTDEHQRIVLETERLLEEAGLERVPGLSERVVRNVEVKAAGRFDDILLERSTGRLLMADLKTKSAAFYSWMTVDAQLAVYANAEYMLAVDDVDVHRWNEHYVDGPKYLVDLTEGVILHVPSDGGQPRLERADLVQGWETAKLARAVVDHRAAGKSVERFNRSAWGAQPEAN
jgi:hypothetical protein